LWYLPRLSNKKLEFSLFSVKTELVFLLLFPLSLKLTPPPIRHYL
jgi:hypothetical protein